MDQSKKLMSCISKNVFGHDINPFIQLVMLLQFNWPNSIPKELEYTVQQHSMYSHKTQLYPYNV